jgi:hypothetical protein
LNSNRASSLATERSDSVAGAQGPTVRASNGSVRQTVGLHRGSCGS